MNLAVSHLVSSRALKELYKMERFYRQKEGRTRKLKEWTSLDRVTFP